MESSFNDDHNNIFISNLRNKITEVYDETKRNIENQSLLLIKIVNQIKRENNLFYHNCLNLLTNEEQKATTSSFTHIDFGQKKDITKLQITNHAPIVNKTKMSPLPKHDSQSLPKKKITKQPKNNSTPPNNTNANTGPKTTEYMKLNMHGGGGNKGRKPQFAFNINKMIQYGKKKNYSYKTQMTMTNNKSSSQFLNHSSSPFNHNGSAMMSSNTSNRKGDEDIKRKENRKMTTNEVRKFSIIDIPCVNMDEIKVNHSQNISPDKSLRDNSIDHENDEEELDVPGEDKQQSLIKSKSKSNKSSFKSTDESLHTYSSQLCYIMAKEAVVPLKLRVMFGAMNSTIYTLYPTIDIINSYMKVITDQLDMIESEEKMMMHFNPSLTAIVNLQLINAKEEQEFIDTIFPEMTSSSSLVSTEKSAFLLKTLQLILILFNGESATYNDDKSQLFNFFLSHHNTTTSLKQSLLTLDVNTITPQSIDEYITLTQATPDLYINQTPNKDTDSFYEKIFFYLKEIYYYLSHRKGHYRKKEQYSKEIKLLEDKLLSHKMHSSLLPE